MKRTIICTLAMLPTVLLALPALAGVVDAAAWVLLGDTLIQPDWAASGRALVAKLRALTYAQEVALVDAVEQWWRSVAQDTTEG